MKQWYYIISAFAIWSCMALSGAEEIKRLAELSSEQAILEMTPMNVAPWISQMGESVRIAYSQLLGDEQLAQFDNAVLPLMNRALSKIGMSAAIKELKATRTQLRKEAVKKVNAEIKAQGVDAKAAQALLAVFKKKLAGADLVFKEFYSEVIDALKAFVQRRKLYMTTGRLASDLDVNMARFIQNRLALRAYNTATKWSAHVIDDLVTATEKAQKIK